MKRKLLLLITLTITLLFSATFFACEKTPTPSQISDVSVTVHDADGTRVERFSAGEVVTLIAASKSGHLFKGWFLDESFSQPLPEDYKAEESVTVYAKYALRIVIGFQTNNGTVVPAQFPESGEPVTPPVLEKSNYLLEGWYYDTSYTQKYQGEGMTSSCTLYAKWVPSSVTVTLWNDTTETKHTVPYGTVVTQIPTRESEVFVGWFYDEDCTQAYLGEPVTESCKLYAAWRPEFITVTLFSAYHEKREVVLLYGSVFEEEDPSYELYCFEGWSYDDRSTVFYAGESITEDLALYAVWKAPVTVTYYGTDGKACKQAVRFGERFDAVAVENDDLYTFVGWFIDKECSKPYEGDFLFTSDTTLYTKWISPLAVKFISYYGGATQTVYCKYGETVDFVQPGERDSYLFRAWYTNATLSKEYDFSAPVTQNLSLYGGWTALYTVVFYPENGEDPIEFVVQSGEKISTPEVVREHFRFDGWKTADGRPFSASSPTQNSETYYAHWYDLRIDSYPDDYMCLIGDVPMITINTDGGAAIASKDVYIGATISLSSEVYPEWNASCRTEIRGRGNSSWWNMEKKSYRLKLENKKFNMAGLSGSKHYALIANMADKTSLRNYIAYCLGRSSESINWSMDTRFVEVTLNGDYVGLYLLVEVVRAEEDRVNLAGTPDNALDYGFLLEQMAENRLDPNEQYVNDGKYYWEIKYPEKEDFTDAEWIAVKSDIQSRLIEARNVITELNYERFTELCDETSYIDFWMIEDLFKNFDCNQLSIFLYKPQGGKLHYGPVWDFDIGAANCRHENVQSPEGSYTTGTTIHGTLMQMDQFAAHYKERVQLHLETDWMYLMTNLHYVLEEIYEASTRNFERWDIAQDLPPNMLECDTYDEQISFLIQWLETRMEWFRKTYANGK